MSLCHWSLTVIFISSLLILQTDGEIHRTSSKSTVKSNRFRQTDVASEIRYKKMMPESEAVRGTINETWFYSIIGALLIGISGTFPLLVIPMEAGAALKHGAAANRLKLFLSFAVGGLLGDVFLHLLPEAYANLEKGDHNGHVGIGLWVITGIFLFLIIEKIFAKEGEFSHLEDECDAQNTVQEVTQTSTQNTQNKNVRQRTKNKSADKKAHNLANNVHHTNSDHEVKQNGKAPQDTYQEPIKVSGYLNLMANVIDNFTHGLAVGGSFLVSNKVGIVTTFAILLHEIPHEIGDFAILLRSGFDRWKAAKAQLLTATGGIVGTITALSAESAKAAGDSTAWILPFTSGGFLYIALVTVVPDLLQEKHAKESIKQVACLCSGIGAMLLVTLIH